MFGYVRPAIPELKCKDFDLYRATYCGLCKCLRQRYGMIPPMFLNYDFTFLALLLWQPEETFIPCKGRCHANLLRKKTMCAHSPALELAADDSVILTWWKLKDSIRDESGWKKAAARLLLLSLRGAYRKAKVQQPSFDAQVEQCLTQLQQLEEEGCASLDRTADTFARILQATVPDDQPQGRQARHLLYHLGRWIYLADAQDDLEEDRDARLYNPVAARYGQDGDPEALKLTLDHSLDQMSFAFQLADFGCRKAVLENILYIGLPLVQRAVFDGSWKEIKKQKVWRNKT